MNDLRKELSERLKKKDRYVNPNGVCFYMCGLELGLNIIDTSLDDEELVLEEVLDNASSILAYARTYR